MSIPASACATCPWRRTNQTAEAIAKSPRAEGERWKWYDPRNLRRLWFKGARNGHPMICHATDPDSSEYGGKGCKPGHERHCVGMLILVARGFEEVNERARAGSLGRKFGVFTRAGCVQWVERLMFNMHPDRMPTAYEPAQAREIRVPWEDAILNKGAL